MSMRLATTSMMASFFLTAIDLKGLLQCGAMEMMRVPSHDALRLLEERDKELALHRDDIRGMIDAGVASLRAGKGVDGDTFLATMDAELAELEARDHA